MKVIVDLDRCESNGVCEQLCPQVFSIDENEFLQLDLSNVTEANRAAIQEAANLCPRGAITVEG